MSGLPHSAWWLTCDALATYRLARLIAVDVITEPLRELVRTTGWLDHPDKPGVQLPIIGPAGTIARWLFDLITCMWCVSLWIAAVVVALTRFVPGGWQYVCMALALSAVAGFLGDR